MGIRGRSGEVIVGNGEGVWKSRSVQRKPFGDRWDPKNADEVKHVPWRTNDDDPKADGEKPEVIVLCPEGEREQREVAKGTAPRRAAITKEDFTKFGFTAKCPGCQAMLRGTARQGHSAGCRLRLEKELAGTTKVDNAERKFGEFMDEALERQRRGAVRPRRPTVRPRRPTLTVTKSLKENRKSVDRL